MSLVRNTVLALTAVVAFGAAMTSAATTAQAWHKPHWKKWYGYHQYYGYRPYYYAEPVAYPSYRSAPAPRPRVVSAPAPAQPPVPAQSQNPANCLSKAYTPEGQVVFSDNCTKESAMAPVPNVPQQGSQQQSGAPQDQSEAPAPQQNFAGKSVRKFGNAQPQQQPQQQQ